MSRPQIFEAIREIKRRTTARLITVDELVNDRFCQRLMINFSIGEERLKSVIRAEDVVINSEFRPDLFCNIIDEIVASIVKKCSFKECGNQKMMEEVE